MTKISIYGTGYVGLVTGVCLAELGHQVLCMDINQAKIDELTAGNIPIYEPGLGELLVKHSQSKALTFTTSIPMAASFATTHFIAVGTPSLPDGGADLSAVFKVAENIAEHSVDNFVIINKSTSPVGTAELIKKNISIYLANQHKKLNFFVGSNPEFLREGCAIEDFLNPCRIIVGVDDENTLSVMEEIYQPLTSKNIPLLAMDLASAELTKYASNAMLATKISFINELANIADLSGGNIDLISQGMGLDKRIGPYFISAGCGYGGSCFPKDVKALVKTASDLDYNAQLINSVDKVNQLQKQRLFEKISAYYQGDLHDKTIAVWGLAFKPDTDDMRDASSVDLIKALIASGAQVKAYDPIAIKNAELIFAENESVFFADDKMEVLTGSDCLVVVTEWNEFLQVELDEVSQKLVKSVIFDGRNIYDFDKMERNHFDYISIGRPNIINYRSENSE